MRRLSWLSLLLFIAFSCSRTVTGLGLLGIDFGCKFIKTGIVQPGKSFEIVLNEASSRKTESILGFNLLQVAENADADSESEGEASLKAIQGIERLFSVDASNLFTKKPQLTFNNLKSKLSSENSKLNFTSGDTTLSFPVEELVGMVLQKTRDLAVDFASEGESSRVEVSDVAITVPSCFTYDQRKSMLAAATISGLNVLSLINENSAAAVNFGMYKSFDHLVPSEDTESGDEEKPSELIIFFNMGYSCTQITIAEYTARNNTLASSGIVNRNKKSTVTPEINILRHECIVDLGTERFDSYLEEEFLKSFTETHKESKGIEKMQEIGERVKARLRKKAEKVKETLSANEAIPVSIESLLPGLDFYDTFNRATLLNAYSKPSIVDLISSSIESLLSHSNKTKSQVSAVELLGGGIRMPFIRSAVEVVFSEQDLEVGTHLNGDEAMALGATFTAANLSKTFRVKPLELTEFSHKVYSVEFSEISPEDDSQDEETEFWQKSANLFTADTALGSRKALTFSHNKNLRIDVFSSESLEAEKKVLVERIHVKNLESLVDKYANKYKRDEDEELQVPKLTFSFHLTPSSTIEVTKAESTFIETIEIIKKSKVNASKEENETEGEEAVDDTEEETEPEEPEVELKEKKHKYPLRFDYRDDLLEGNVITSQQISASIERLEVFSEIESKRQALEFELNALETLIFSSRDRISSIDSLSDAVSEEEIESFFEYLEQEEDWLDDAEPGAITEEVLKSKKKEIATTVEDLLNVYHEFILKDDIVERSLLMIGEVSKFIDRIPSKRSWIVDVKDGLKSLDSLQELSLSLQSTLESKDFTIKEIIPQLESLQRLFEKLVKVKQPPPPKPVKVVELNETAELPDSETEEGSEEVEMEEDEIDVVENEEGEEADEEESEEQKDEL